MMAFFALLHLFGHRAIGLQRARMARAALARIATRTQDAFSRAKPATGRYYVTRELAASRMLRARFGSGAQPVLALAPEAF